MHVKNSGAKNERKAGETRKKTTSGPRPRRHGEDNSDLSNARGGETEEREAQRLEEVRRKGLSGGGLGKRRGKNETGPLFDKGNVGNSQRKAPSATGEHKARNKYLGNSKKNPRQKASGSRPWRAKRRLRKGDASREGSYRENTLQLSKGIGKDFKKYSDRLRT